MKLRQNFYGNYGVSPYAHQAKILRYPLNRNFVFFIGPKFIFIVLGKNVFLNLIAMGAYGETSVALTYRSSVRKMKIYKVKEIQI
ncbi:hypothetical protein EXW51_28055 (plasmid) [Bacillus mycoides]|nr:hypothetical protein EXW51_28055 [Bacillus mycoides]